jgi:hypothetical protein
MLNANSDTRASYFLFHCSEVATKMLLLQNNSANPSAFTLGYLDPTHVSTLSASYAPGSQPTPWPVVAASTRLSILLGSVSLISGVKLHQNLVRNGERMPSPGKFAVISSNSAAVISTIRSIATLVLAIENFTLESPRRLAPSAVLLLFISLAIATENYSLFLISNTLNNIDILLVFSAFVIISRTNTGKSAHYAQTVIQGGNCPLSAPDVCHRDPSRYFERVGCGAFVFSQEHDKATYLHTSETVLGYFGLVYCAFFSVVAIIELWNLLYEICSRYQDHSLWLKTMAYSDQQDVNRNKVSEYSRENHKFKVWTIFASIVFAVVIAGSTIPLHVVQEQNPQAFPYLDSFGEADVRPLVLGTSTGDNVTSWTDCFFVKLPSDRFGFFKEWWDEKKSTRLSTILAFV